MATIVFGHGYTGSRLNKIISGSIATELPSLCKEGQIPFDFNNESTWSNLPMFDSAVITFKMTDEVQASKFSHLLKDKKTIVLSSARNLLNTQPDEVINEFTPLADSLRAKSEKYFEPTAIILYLGLIWGKKRTPLKWLTENRIKNGSKYINLIHVDDLCQIIKHFLENDFKPDKYLISDGDCRKWRELANNFGCSLNSQENGLESRIFNTEKLTSVLPEGFCFTKVSTNS